MITKVNVSFSRRAGSSEWWRWLQEVASERPKYNFPSAGRAASRVAHCPAVCNSSSVSVRTNEKHRQIFLACTWLCGKTGRKGQGKFFFSFPWLRSRTQREPRGRMSNPSFHRHVSTVFTGFSHELQGTGSTKISILWLNMHNSSSPIVCCVFLSLCICESVPLCIFLIVSFKFWQFAQQSTGGVLLDFLMDL